MTDFSDLIAGYRRFRTESYAQQHDRWAKLAEGQSPRVMVIACADSRTDPAQVFDASPGEIFVARNIANLVPPYATDGGAHGVAAALEYAVTQLKVGEIVIMGHGKCGGCKAALTQVFADAAPGEGGFVQGWVRLLDDARARVIAEHGEGAEAERAMELEAIRASVANLRTFPFVREAEAAGSLALRGAHFSVTDGKLHVMDAEGEFAPA